MITTETNSQAREKPSDAEFCNHFQTLLSPGNVTAPQHTPQEYRYIPILDDPIRVDVCWSLTSLCHSNGHIETMPAREINPFTALTRIRS